MAHFVDPDTPLPFDLSYVEDAEAEIDGKEMRSPRSPVEACYDESFHQVPIDLPDISSKELSQRHGAAKALLSYAGRFLAQKRAKLKIINKNLAFIKAQAMVQLGGGRDSKKYLIESALYNDKVYMNLSMEATNLEVLTEMQESVLNQYQNLSEALSREMTRRQYEYNSYMRGNDA